VVGQERREMRMSQFPGLLDAQRRALFEIVEAFRKHDLEGRPVIVVTELGYPRLILSMGEESPHIDTDLDTLRVLDQARYVAFTESPQSLTLTLRKLASDYYDWYHSTAWYKPVAERWLSLAPDTRSAIVGGVSGSATTFLLGLLGLLIRGCLSR